MSFPLDWKPAFVHFSVFFCPPTTDASVTNTVQSLSSTQISDESDASSTAMPLPVKTIGRKTGKNRMMQKVLILWSNIFSQSNFILFFYIGYLVSHQPLKGY